MKINCFVVCLSGILINSNAFHHGRLSRKTTLYMTKSDSSTLFSSFSKISSKSLPVILGFGLFFSSPTISPPPAFAAEELVDSPWTSGVKYTVVKSGTGASPKVGDMVSIRFRGSYKGNVFDDTFSTSEPYLYRAGLGSIVKGLDDTIIHMKVGDRLKLQFGGDLAFGSKGKASSPGKPRIPPMAEIDYEVELVELPGYGDDIILDVASNNREFRLCVEHE
eukprot:gene9547-19846_t